MKKPLIILFLLFSSLNIHAQNFNFGAITYDDYEFDRKKLDSNANAIVLKEFGTASIQRDDNTGSLELIFEHHIKIKIYNKEGFKEANIIIPTYKDDTREETISELKASTFNYIQNNFVETAMDKKAIFTENRSKYTRLTKFTLPNLKEGSIIEYSYKLRSPNLFNFKTWEFQSDIPKVSSEYLVYIPGIYNYNVSLRGFQKLTDQKVELSKECLRLSGAAIDCSKITYLMKDIPAFIEEDNMTAPSNFKSAIYFELSDVQNLNGGKTSYTKTWKDVDYELTSYKTLGDQMKRKDVFKDLIPSITKGSTDDLEKAKAIYNYIKKQIKWDNYYGKYSEDNIKKALESRSGNVADINLSLISALSTAGLDAEAVILSTRDNGTVNKLYPVMSDFNYLVAKVNIGDKSYLLDATEPLLPFGLLPLRCINDQGRVINLKKPSYWIDLKASQKTVTSYILMGKMTTDGKIVGTLTTHSLGYAAYNKRRDILKYSSPDEYVEKLDERLTRIKILEHNISNLDSVENTLVEKYEIEFTVNDGANNNQFYFSPFFINTISKNPFNLNERTYPVDLGAASDERIIINVTLPEKYQLMEKPKDMAIALPNAGGKYLLQTGLQDDTISMSQILQFNNAIYQPEEYLFLKEFYSKIIQNQKTEFLLKKGN
ncbi:transglutaminase domain-containing protein [Pedobacter psychrodurus]|uniref:transglutaminase domain-containing protein n=1 Tax=Pedobacter psychrodurus TaxID=2530456 RepID=UPI00292E7383|nr:transglutaminase domain-containing protein [Pedobacter psychrodurus]